MSQSFNSMQNEVVPCPSMMTFKDYYMGFIGVREPHLANGWGWFVDIELNPEPIRRPQYKYNRNKPSQYVSISDTIKEYPSIRSMKSMKNLYDATMIFDMDDDLEKHRTNKKILNICLHVFCIITLMTICYYLTGV
jgi:hypothetical protein